MNGGSWQQLYLEETGNHPAIVLQSSLIGDQVNCMYSSSTQEVRTKEITEPEEMVWVPGAADCLGDAALAMRECGEGHWDEQGGHGLGLRDGERRVSVVWSGTTLQDWIGGTLVNIGELALLWASKKPSSSKTLPYKLTNMPKDRLGTRQSHQDHPSERNPATSIWMTGRWFVQCQIPDLRGW